MPYKNPIKQKKAQAKYYKDNKKEYISRNQSRRLTRKIWFSEITKDLKCVNCPESNNACLDFHHVDPTTKIQSVAELLNSFRSKEVVLTEMEKCCVLCSNYHRKLHANQIQLQPNPPLFIRVSPHT